MNKPPSSMRKTPGQQRSRTLVNAIIEASQKILAEEGASNLTTNRIAEVAGVTIGSLYQYFPNKEAILTSLFTEKLNSDAKKISRDSTARVLTHAKKSLRKTIREIILVLAEAHVDFYNVQGEFYREYHDFFNFHDEVDSINTKDFDQPSWEEWLPELLTRFKHEIQVKNIEQAAFITGNIVNGLLISALEQNPEWLSDLSYLDQVESAAMNYLTHS